MNNPADNTVQNAFEFFKAECKDAVERTYEKLLVGLEEMKGIERQRAIKQRVKGICIKMRDEPGMAVLDVTEWLDENLEKVAQKKDDLP